MNKIQIAFQVVGEIGTAMTLAALLFPKGSKVGYWLAKLGADIKGHTMQSVQSAEDQKP